jgi:hypothetical protein
LEVKPLKPKIVQTQIRGFTAHLSKNTNIPKLKLCEYEPKWFTDDRGVGQEVLVAAFHPMFEFQGLSGEETALNFEKRSPVPVSLILLGTNHPLCPSTE